MLILRQEAREPAMITVGHAFLEYGSKEGVFATAEWPGHPEAVAVKQRLRI